ncbi:MAG: transketolase family protein [Planctomycetes bacterium]|nr:transketolase family protein [Planctomycetota bacterium]
MSARPYPEVLLELARENPAVVGLAADCSGCLASLASEFPDRALDLGIAESNLIGVAAGLAIRGKVPFAHGMAPFLTMRSFEQIRTDLGYGHRNVKVVSAACTGLTGGVYGPTHHAIEEIALMRLIPGMTVLMPADAWQTEQAARAAASLPGCVYLSLASGDVGLDESGRTFEVGRAELLRPGRDVTLVTTGVATAGALEAAETLAAAGVSARLLSMHTVKPLDVEAIRSAARETRGLVTVEEHSILGGLGGAVAEVMAEWACPVPLRRVGLPDVFAWKTGGRESLRRHYHLGAEAIVAAVRDLLGTAITETPEKQP